MVNDERGSLSVHKKVGRLTRKRPTRGRSYEDVLEIKRNLQVGVIGVFGADGTE